MSVRRDADRIPAKTDEEAQDRFLSFLRKSLTALDTQAVWLAMPAPYGAALHTASTSPETLRLKTNDPNRCVYLRSTIQFTLGDHPDYPGERKVFTENYAHTISWEPGQKPELCSWQWDASSDDGPHVHVHRGVPEAGSLGKLHIPTARVTFEQVSRFALRDLDVLPNRQLAPTEEERMAKALALLAESDRRVQAFGRSRR